MPPLQADQSRRTTSSKATAGRRFVLDLSEGRISTINPDGSNGRVIVTGCRHPVSTVVDVECPPRILDRQGRSEPERRFDRAHRHRHRHRHRQAQSQDHRSAGATFTPKQLHLDKRNGKLYWSDREGIRVIRASLDGSHVETLVHTGQADGDRADATRWCVGITLDPERDQIYWMQQGPDDGGRGRIFRAGIEIPKGVTAAHRSAIEVLLGLLELRAKSPKATALPKYADRVA